MSQPSNSGTETLSSKASLMPGIYMVLRRAGFYISLAYLIFLVLLSISAPWVAPFSPTMQNPADVLMPTGAPYLLGTDDLGRDVLSRLIWGAPLTLYGSVLAVLVACAIGLPFGLIAGFSGGWIDAAISRTIDTMLSFPAIVLAIGVTGVLGVGQTNSMIAIGIVFSPTIARLVRGQTLIGREALYVDAARCFGASNTRLILRHILPNAVQPVIVQVTLLLATALLAEASLSFLGLGVQPPQPSWGAMLARAYHYMEIAPSQMYAPGIAILVTALSFNTLGENLRVILDPTQKRR
ncbi:ABC transporter permease [Ferrovibrio sp.]|uniref:ABC transporter permease n=1 Tax=Ferrovibrio sp. TaxID=1917215 RepID=UPI0025BD35B4|nr:ABC transporter permease [Ferrovibrio sp.]